MCTFLIKNNWGKQKTKNIFTLIKIVLKQKHHGNNHVNKF